MTMLPALAPTASAWIVIGKPVIQVLLIVGVLAVAFLLLRGQGARHQALRRILLLVFALAAIASIVFPQAWTAVANLVGVGRGTDLLLYVLIIAFLSYVATRYAKDRRVERQVTLLARRIALDEAGSPADAAARPAGAASAANAPDGEPAHLVPDGEAGPVVPDGLRPGDTRPEAGRPGRAPAAGDEAPWTG